MQLESLIKKNKYQFTVLTRKKHVTPIKIQLETMGGNQVKVIGIDLPKCLLFWKKGHLSMHIYYYIWQLQAYFVARNCLKNRKYHMIHHLSFMSLRTNMAPFLGIPSLMGPVGGGQLPPSGFKNILRSPFKEKLRTFTIYTMKYSPLWRSFARRFSKIYLANSENLWLFPDKQHNCEVLQIGWPENIDNGDILHKQNDILKIYWGGRLIGWKGLEILIRSLPLIGYGEKNFILDITGTGPDSEHYIKLSDDLGISDKINFHGWIDNAEKQKLQKDSDICVFTSLHETTGTALMEMMAYGKPVIVLDHAGPGEIVTEKTAIKVAVNKGASKAILDLAVALTELMQNPSLRKEIGVNALKHIREKHNWDKYINKIDRTYGHLCSNKHAEGSDLV